MGDNSTGSGALLGIKLFFIFLFYCCFQIFWCSGKIMEWHVKQTGFKFSFCHNMCIIFAQSTFSNLVYPSEKLSSLGQHMVFVGCAVDASFPFFCLIFLTRTLISSWSRVTRRTCSKAFESDGRVAQNHFRPMPLEDNSGKYQTSQSKWIIRTEFSCLIHVHIKCLIITLRGW